MGNIENTQFETVKSLLSSIGAQFVVYNDNIHLISLKQDNTFVMDHVHFEIKTLTIKENEYFLDGVKCRKIEANTEEQQAGLASNKSTVVTEDIPSPEIMQIKVEPVDIKSLVDFGEEKPFDGNEESLVGKEVSADKEEVQQHNTTSNIKIEEEPILPSSLPINNPSSANEPNSSKILLDPTEKSDGNTISLKRKQYEHLMPPILTKKRQIGLPPALLLKYDLKSIYKDPTYIQDLQQTLTSLTESLVMGKQNLFQDTMKGAEGVEHLILHMQAIIGAHHNKTNFV
ncbi:unnamed protein product [Mucor hiemalis]